MAEGTLQCGWLLGRMPEAVQEDGLQGTTGSTPVMSEAFKRIAMDIVGLLPRSSWGNWYVLAMCDYATPVPRGDGYVKRGGGTGG